MTRADLLCWHKEICADAFGTFEKKGNDYATDVDPLHNINACRIVKITPAQAILVRMIDKISRLGNVADGKSMQVEETVADTIEDLINYAVLLKVAFAEGVNMDTTIPQYSRRDEYYPEPPRGLEPSVPTESLLKSTGCILDSCEGD